MLCPACEDWPLAPQDWFCPGCGASTLGCRLEAAGELGKRYPELRLDDSRGGLEALVFGFAVGGPEDAVLAMDPADDLPATDLEDGAYPLLLGAEDSGGFAISAHVVVEAPGGQRVASPAVAQLALDHRFATLELETPRIEAEAITPIGGRLGPAGAWLRLRVRNVGVAASIAAAVVRLERAERVGEPPAYNTPIVLLPGERALLRAWLSQPDAAFLATAYGSIRGTVTFLDANAERYVSEQPIRIVRQGDLDVALDVRPHLPALLGRHLRAPWRLKNTGGQSLMLGAMRLRLKAADGERVFDVGPGENAGAPTHGVERIEPGEVREGELRIATPELPPGRQTEAWLEVEVDGVIDGRRALAAPFLLEARAADHPFVGRVSLDFGTTESAAAAIAGPPPDHEVLEIGAPFMVDLGRVGVDGAGSGERFLPSQGVALKSGEVLFGEAMHTAPAHQVAHRVENFKWMLTPKPSNAAQREANEVAVKYLGRMKTLIEEHPDVAGVIGLQTVVLATCPTQFAPGMRSRLAAAMVEAGFPDPRTRVFDPRHQPPGILIAESWSPLPYALFDDPDLFVPLGVDRDVPRPILRLNRGETGHVVVLDIGGGSADVSTLRTARSKSGRYEISQTYRKTNTTFVGREFLADIKSSYAKWRPGGPHVEDAALMRAFQYANGVFGSEEMDQAFSAYFEQRLKGQASPEDDLLVIPMALAPQPTAPAAEKDLAQRLNAHFDRMSPLKLATAEGDIELSKEQLVTLASQVVADFLHRHLDSLDAIVSAAVETAVEAGGPLYLIPSGRGSAYPLARRLIYEARRLHASAALQSGLSPREAKSITCWGALYLADLATSGADFQIDLSDDQCVLVWAGRDADSKSISYSPAPWVENPPAGRRVAAVQLSELPESAWRQADARLYFGDPDSEVREARDRLGVVAIPEAARRKPDGHWVIVEIDGESRPVRGPAVVAAADAKAAFAKLRRQTQSRPTTEVAE